MSNVVVDKQKIDLLANAIAGKSGVPVTMTLDEMKEAVDGIDVSGIVPTGNINITHSGQTDVTNYATATVPDAQSGLSAYSNKTFWTDPNQNQRKWQLEYGGMSTASGWVDDDDESTPVREQYNAVPANTTVTPSTSAQTIGGANYMMEGAVTVEAMPNGTAGTPTANKGTVSNHAVTVTPSVTNSAGYITGGTKNGTAVSVSASELVSGTYTVSASGTHDVTNYASASVASGSATASATKGTVSNHSVTVTPSVTRTAGYVTAGTATGTGVSVSASELVSGSQTITENGTVDVTNLAEIVVAVEGGGSSGVKVEEAWASSNTSSISFTGLKGEPTSFMIIYDGDSVTPGANAQIDAIVFDGTSLHGQTITNTSNAQVSYDSAFTKSYSNGTLTVTSTNASFIGFYGLHYSYGGSSANIDAKDVQVGSGATSITFTGLDDEPIFWSCIFKSNFSTSSGYQRVICVRKNSVNIYGHAMDSATREGNYWTASYSNGSLTITSQGTNQGGYFHQPGYYQLTAVYGGEIEPTEIEVEPLSVTQNGTYTAPTGTAYSPVTVNVSGGSVNVATTTWTNSDSTATTHTFTGLLGTPKAAFLRCTASLSRSSSSSNYYVADMRWTGTATAGNSFRRSNGTFANVTSGYSFSASGTSLTVTTSGTSTTNPGSFYNSSYELTYVY